MDDFELEVKRCFLDEATQLLDDCEEAFLKLESNREDKDVLAQLFRLAHNLKGSSRGVGFGEIAELTHELENLLLKLKEGQLPVSDGTVNVLLKCTDFVRTMVKGLKENPAATFDFKDLITQIRETMEGKAQETSAPASAPAPEAPAAPQEQAETQTQSEPEPEPAAAETFQAAPAEAPAYVPPQPSPSQPAPQAAQQQGETIRVGLDKIEKLNDFVGELVIMQSVIAQQCADGNSPEMAKAISQLSKITKEVQEISMSLRMLPVKQTFTKMQRIARDTAKIVGKKAELHLSGEETEVDKTILEILGDPLVHTVRNAIDHGLESPEERAKAGKPENGSVWLRAYHEANYLVIEVEDDGKGLDPQKLIAKAREKGLISPTAQLSDQEAWNLIFHPGFSTKSEVSEISGRGVGLDVVRTNISKISGTISLTSVLGKGTRFKMMLPLTLAIIDGLVINVGAERFVVPLTQVHETLKVQPEHVNTFAGLGEVLKLRGETLRLHRMGNAIGRTQDKAKEMIAIVARNTQQAFAVVVDEIVRQQQVVIKTLSSEVRVGGGFTGSAILGDGRPSLILDLFEMFGKRRQ